jgi:hypothetical protein
LADNLLVNDISERVEQSRYFPILLRTGRLCAFLRGRLSSWLHSTILDAILHQFLSCHCDEPRAMVVMRNRLFGRGVDLFASFVNGCRSLVLGDVEGADHFLSAFRRAWIARGGKHGFAISAVGGSI